MELRTFAEVEIIGRVTSVPPFTLQTSPCRSYYMHLRNKHFEIGFTNFTTTTYVPDSLNLDRCIMEYPSDWPTKHLTANKVKVFDSLTVHNYCDAVLDAKWNPDDYATQKPTVTPFKAEFSPTVHGQAFVAILMNNGSFHVYRREALEWTDCCDIGSDHVKQVNSDHTLTKYEDVLEILGYAEVVSFEWLHPNGDEIPLIWISKNGTVFSGTLNTTTYKMEMTIEPHELHKPSSMKLVTSDSKEDFLIVASTDGTVSLHGLERSLPFLTLNKLVDLWTEEDEISISYVLTRWHKNGLRILIVKGSFLMIFELNRKMKRQNTIIKRMPCPFITALEFIDDHSFMVALVNHTILHGVVNKDELTTTEIHNAYDRNFSCSGIIRLRNCGIWMLSFTASKAHDYTALKCPERLTLATLSKTNPFEVMLNDPEKRISNHLEYFEMLRVTQAQTLTEYTKVLSKINSTNTVQWDQILYLLKIQSFLTEIPTMPKNKPPPKDVVHKVAFIRDLIMAISLHRSLEALLECEAKHSHDQILSMKNISNFLTTTIQTQTQPDYAVLLKRVRDIFGPTLEKCKTIDSKAVVEKCALCDHDLIQGKLSCVQLHEIRRCCYTHLQVPLLSPARCRVCGMQSLDVQSINRILGTKITRSVCPVCDCEIE